MFNYVVEKEKNLVRVMKEGKFVGQLNYVERDGLIGLDVFKLPFEEGNASMDGYFKVMNKVSGELEQVFGSLYADFKKIVWGCSAEIKDFDLNAQDIDQNYKPVTKAKGKKK